MKIIKLKSGKEVKVCNCHYDLVKDYKWYKDAVGYARRTKKSKCELMHRMIMETPEGKQTDHINEDKLDNRCCNLRVCNHSQNLMNRGKLKNNKSGYKGVTWYESMRKWRAVIGIGGAKKYLGCYKNIEEAAQAYNNGAIKYFGEFANLNNL